MSLINSSVKPFKATAFHNGKFVIIIPPSFIIKVKIHFFTIIWLYRNNEFLLAIQ